MDLSTTDYAGRDAVDLARLVRDREVDGVALSQAALALADELGALNAVADRVEDPVVSATGPLAGVPFGVKELLPFPGLPWTLGSRLMAGNPAPGLTPYAAALQQAGLTVLVSTTSSELGLLGSTESLLRGPTLNPWGEGLSAGGSSGGSAALVAAGVLPVAHGSDAGGSLRVPASMNGVFGFKPTNGRLAEAAPGPTSGLGALVVDHCMSRSVRDSALLLALTERTPEQPPAEDRLRIGVLSTTLLGRGPDAQVAAELARVAALCTALGHHVEEASPPPVDGRAFSEAFFTSAAITLGQVATMVTPLLGRPPGPDELEPFSLELLAWGASLAPTAGEDAERAVAQAGQAYLTLFAHHDVVLSPTLATLPWALGHLSPDAGRQTLVQRTEESVGYTPGANAAGCPAMSVPLGVHDGVPVGSHFVARPGADLRLMALALELEQADPWAHRRPDTRWLR